MSGLDCAKTVFTVIDVVRYTDACDVTVWAYDTSHDILRSSMICNIHADDADVTHVNSEQTYRVKVYLGNHMITLNGEWVNCRSGNDEVD